MHPPERRPRVPLLIQLVVATVAGAAAGASSVRPKRRPGRWTVPPGLQVTLDAITAGPAFIRNGRLDGMLRDVAYQATTTDFWGSMEAVGGPSTYVLGGAFNCGKGQPGQVAPVSHGAPSALFRGVNILNTLQEAGQ